ncbi:hypothetical protein DH2020_026906 [Rehmannia glutinosa]|uniref:Uncharacterized protein n=1 Tax=Rehmannia glutinosa TaxID=99300 RepID=A0ABR0VY29_REHGL
MTDQNLMPGMLKQRELDALYQGHQIPESVRFWLPYHDEVPQVAYVGCIAMYAHNVTFSLNFPLPRLITNWFRRWETVLSQVHPMTWRRLIGLVVLFARQGFPHPRFEEIKELFVWKATPGGVRGRSSRWYYLQTRAPSRGSLSDKFLQRLDDGKKILKAGCKIKLLTLKAELAWARLRGNLQGESDTKQRDAPQPRPRTEKGVPSQPPQRTEQRRSPQVTEPRTEVQEPAEPEEDMDILYRLNWIKKTTEKASEKTIGKTPRASLDPAGQEKGRPPLRSAHTEKKKGVQGWR